MRLIDADAIIIDLLDRGIEGVQTDDYAEFQQIVEDAPTVDAVPVVRCKDCKYHYVDGDNVRFNLCLLNHNKVQADDWYCADGKRREEDE